MTKGQTFRSQLCSRKIAVGNTWEQYMFFLSETSCKVAVTLANQNWYSCKQIENMLKKYSSYSYTKVREFKM